MAFILIVECGGFANFNHRNVSVLEIVQVQNSIFIENNARRGSLKVRLEKWRPLHAKIQVVLVMADDPLKVRFRLEF